MQCFQCQNQMESAEDLYRLESDPYHLVCEDCAANSMALKNQPENELDYIISTYFSSYQKRKLIQNDPIAYSYFINDRLSDMRVGTVEDYMEVG